MGNDKTILIADSGATKTDWCLICGQKTLRRVATQGLNPFHLGDDEIACTLTKELLPMLGNDKPYDIFFYGSGCRGERANDMRRLLSDAFGGTAGVEMASDMLGAARALCGRSPGVACIIGTGSNSCRYDGTAIVDGIPALGYVLGDEGSGAAIGIALVNAIYKRRLPNAVRETFERETGLTLDDILRRTYREPQPSRFLASLTAFAAAHSDVEGVAKVVEDCLADFLRRCVLPLGHADLPVNAIGGIAATFESELRKAARKLGLHVGKVAKSPMEGLIDFHSDDVA